MKTILHRKQSDGSFRDEMVDIDCHFANQVKRRNVVADPQGNWRASGIDKVPVVYEVTTMDYPKNPYPKVPDRDWKERVDAAYPHLITVKTRKFARKESFGALKSIYRVVALASGIHEIED